MPTGNIKIRVTGNGSLGSSKGFLLETDHVAYMFNCGESILRQCSEHGGKWSKLEHVFITYNSWSHTAGILDMCLSLEEVHGKGARDIHLHGPGHLDALVNDESRRFAVKAAKNAVMWPSDKTFADHLMTVDGIKLWNEDHPDSAELCAHAFHLKFNKPTRKVDRYRLATLGIKFGPWVGELQTAKTDTVEVEGRILRCDDYLMPAEDPGLMTVVECPTTRHLDSMLNSSELLTIDGKNQDLVIHMTPYSILTLDAYQQWMKRFSPNTKHLLINEEHDDITFSYAWSQQIHLNMIVPDVFPSLHPKPISQDRDLYKGHELDSNVWYGHPGATYCHRPLKQRGLSYENVPHMKIESALEYFKDLKAVKAALALRKSDYTVTDDTREFPVVSFLGTSSSVSTRNRNVSGIFVQISESSNLVMDCGSGAYGQLQRLYGKTDTQKKIKDLKAIFISHGHADHHLGLPSFLFARKSIFEEKKVKPPCLYLLAPGKLRTWFQHLSNHFSGLMENVRFIPLNWLCSLSQPEKHQVSSEGRNQFSDPYSFTKKDYKDFVGALNLSQLLAVKVDHAYSFQCFGLSITHKDGWKVVYSGDTMPCDALVNVARNCDLLIHEATFGDACAKDARLKTHSTTEQAMDIATKANAKFTLLTHFSTRYPRLPDYSKRLMNSSNVGITFDNAVVRFRDLPNLTLKSLWDVMAEMYPQYADNKKMIRVDIQLMKNEGMDPGTIVRKVNEATALRLERRNKMYKSLEHDQQLPVKSADNVSQVEKNMDITSDKPSQTDGDSSDADSPAKKAKLSG